MSVNPYAPLAALAAVPTERREPAGPDTIAVGGVMAHPARQCVLIVVALSVLWGCGPSPIVGRWTRSASTTGSDLTAVEAFNADGSATITLSGAGACTGTIAFTGLTWTADATSIVFSGRGACAGTVNCVISGTNVVIDCAHAPNGPQEGACDYTLSADGNSLTISNCTGSLGGSTTYSRAPN